jgi:GAF domain-containing protein/CheY-like chemotaxis protein
MAGSTKSGLLVRLSVWFAAGFALALPLTAEIRLTLDGVAKRNPGNYSSVYEGQAVVVRGVVNTAAIRFNNYTILGIEANDSGGVLRVSGNDTLLNKFQPGDELEVAGKVVTQYGVPMIEPERILQVGHKAVPVPTELNPRSAQDLRYVGRLVRIEGTISAAPAHNAGGAMAVLSGGEEPYMIFVPRAPGQAKADLSQLRKGDVVSVTGLALQYAPVPPHNTGFEVVTADVRNVLPIQRSGTLSAPMIAISITLLLLIGFLLWSRERRLRIQRKKLRKTYQLGEEILSAASPATILKRLSESLPTILGITRVQLYLYNRGGKTLDAIAGETGEAESISLSAPPEGTPAGAVACFHYRTLLVIPDIDRSPFPLTGEAGQHSPKSLLFVPMMAQADVVGVLQLDQNDRVRDFSPDEQALAQHLGNQIGVALRLLDQRTVQEQLFRTEKLAAIGRLISGVVSELQTPLASITDLANRALEKSHGGPAEREVAAIASEAAKAIGMVTRLVSFASSEQVEARPVDVNGLLRTLIDFREGDWKARGLRIRDLTSREPQYVLGSHGQLEQVFLNLLVHAEQSLAQAEQKTLTIRTSLLARRLLVEITFSAPAEARKPEETAAVLGVTRSVIAGHGGEVRLIEKSPAEPRFEIELPAQARERNAGQFPTQAAPLPVREGGRRMTALVIELEETPHRQLLAMLSARGYRVVPVGNSDAGLDLAQRLRFDAAFVSLHAPGLNWVELSERMQSRVGGFVLLSDGYDAELTADFEGEGRFVLAKPIQESDLDRVLRQIEPRGATIIPFKTGTA